MQHLILRWLLQASLADLPSTCTLATSMSYYPSLPNGSLRQEYCGGTDPINVVSKSQHIQTACLDRSHLLLPLLLSVLSTLSYLSVWQDPGGWSSPGHLITGQSPVPCPCDLLPECSHNTFQNFTHSSHGLTCSNRPLSCLQMLSTSDKHAAQITDFKKYCEILLYL